MKKQKKLLEKAGRLNNENHLYRRIIYLSALGGSLYARVGIMDELTRIIEDFAERHKMHTEIMRENWERYEKQDLEETEKFLRWLRNNKGELNASHAQTK